jgi:hypothetical protein
LTGRRRRRRRRRRRKEKDMESAKASVVLSKDNLLLHFFEAGAELSQMLCHWVALLKEPKDSSLRRGIVC